MKSRFKVYDLVYYRAPYDHDLILIGEVISMRDPSGMYFVRQVPDDCTTAIYMQEACLTECTQERRDLYSHFAIVRGSTPFPVEAMRRSKGAPVTFKLDEQGVVIFNDEAWRELLIGACTLGSSAPWTDWGVYMWSVKHLVSRPLMPKHEKVQQR